jgi:predicted RNase H-like nuclease (RuvC/YqgF family)
VSRFIPVEPEKWMEMVKAQAENARLKAEVERLGAFKTHTIIPNERLEVDLENCRIALRVKYEEVAKFKAEVERLTNNCNYLDQKLDEELDKSAMLCGQVERLTKAGDEMARVISSFGFDEAPIAWNRAKEGKQS